MKKTLCTLIVIAISFVGCTSTEVALKDDSPIETADTTNTSSTTNTSTHKTIDKSEYSNIRWASIGNGFNTNINFKTVGENGNVVLELEYLSNNTIIVAANHKVILTFSDGETLELDYDQMSSQYSYNTHKIIATLNTPLKNFGTLKTAQIETKDESINIPVTEKEAKRLIRLFNELKIKA